MISIDMTAAPTTALEVRQGIDKLLAEAAYLLAKDTHKRFLECSAADDTARRTAERHAAHRLQALVGTDWTTPP